eukprot:GILJ01006406.1.p1 GENE.GILJ01006406.1~~GILJ01006406.1.p1  ORF type:complete len:896 (+),score=141.32 GILJ01006406.1:59-2746(+)
MEPTSPQQQEERILLTYINWLDLPEGAKRLFQNNKKIWKKKMRGYRSKYHIRWNGALDQLSPPESKFLLGIVKSLRRELKPYPYHLADVLCPVLKLTPFKYYGDLLMEVLKAERAYDSMPNFTAADCLRLLEIGRNRYIHILNKYRAIGWMARLNRGSLTKLLPQTPAPSYPEHWFIIRSTMLPSEPLKGLSEEESSITQRLQREPCMAGQLSKDLIREMFVKQLVYYEVPIHDEDRIVVPPLSTRDFVINRTTTDDFEKLMYQIFVSLSENSTVRDLCHLLSADVTMIKDAVSFYCRLGIAKKKTAPPLEAHSNLWHPSWLQEYLPADPSLPPMPLHRGPSRQDISALHRQPSKAFVAPLPRIGFVFASDLAAYLMMGNLSASLKSHAMTLFEVGKLQDEALDDFIRELDQVKNLEEGDTAIYFTHAVSLRETLSFLRQNEAFQLPGCARSVDLLRIDSLNSLDAASRFRLLERHYGVLVSMCPLSLPHALLYHNTKPMFFGPPLPLAVSIWSKLFLYHAVGCGPVSIFFVRGSRIFKLPRVLQIFDVFLVTPWEQQPQEVVVDLLLPYLNEFLLCSPVLVQGIVRNSNKSIPVKSTQEASSDVVSPLPQLSSPTSKHANSVSTMDGTRFSDSDIVSDENDIDSEEGDVITPLTSPSIGQQPPKDNSVSTVSISASCHWDDVALPCSPESLINSGHNLVQQYDISRLLSNFESRTGLGLNRFMGFFRWIGIPENVISDDSGRSDSVEDSRAAQIRRRTSYAALSSFSSTASSSVGNLSSVSWVPFEVQFGIPLHDIHLNRRIRENARVFDCFTQDSVSRFLDDQRAFVLKFLEFIIDQIIDSDGSEKKLASQEFLSELETERQGSDESIMGTFFPTYNVVFDGSCITRYQEVPL